MTVEQAFWNSWFGISITGVALVALLVAAVVVHLLCKGRRNWPHRWLLAITACVGLATIMTPADIASTLILATAFLAFFAFGASGRPASGVGTV